MKRCVPVARWIVWTLPATLAAILVGVASVVATDDPVETTPPPVKVMSFNIRYAAAADGANAWPHRSAFVLETIRTFDPDLLGAQEVLFSQASFLRGGARGIRVPRRRPG